MDCEKHAQNLPNPSLAHETFYLQVPAELCNYGMFVDSQHTYDQEVSIYA